MIIMPNLRWQTFTYWAVKDTDVQGIGSSPVGVNLVIPPLTLTLKAQINPQHTTLLSDASSPHRP
jgi:hypothetical protein